MASAESVKMGSLVAPAEPDEAADADVADPGEVEKVKLEQREAGTGKYGSTNIDPAAAEEAASESSDPDEPPTWIEIELLDDDDQPIAGEVYRVTTPDGKVRSGTLNDKGFARVEGVKKGQCKVTFPRLDEAAWRKA
ncbi:MAG: hypothetical protein HBSAPP03_24870 [Phycisphaerae bacterium]|nr:MAG: hypothetical protein HBSAPP03_24870 [Phycisphaerae bacterium]